MLMQKCTSVKLSKTYNKILYLYEAYNQTFVFLGMLGPRKDCIVHVNKQGKELFCHIFERAMDTLGMMTQYEAVFLQTRANCITILDLKSYQFRRIPHYFMNPESDQCSLYTFANTKYLGIVEYGRYNDNRLRITYLNYPQKNPIILEDKPQMYHRKELLQKEFQTRNDEWTFEYQLVKGNNHSMVIWFRDRHDQTFQFKFFRQDNNYMPLYRKQENNTNGWEYQCFKIQHGLKTIYNFARLNISVNEVFEFQKDKIMVFCMSNRQKPLNQQQPIKNSYVVDLMTSTVNQSVHNLGALHQLQIDRKMFGTCHMIRTFAFKNGQALETPVYYFSNNNFEIISQSKWVCSYLTKYTFPGYDGHLMIESEYENGQVKEFKCWYKKLIEYKELIMFFLLEINENFDDDLMQEVVQLIT